MKENSIDENNTSSKKIKRRKRNIKYVEEDSDKEKERHIKKNLDEKNKNEKQLEIQKKLKYIFNEVRAKGK